MKKIIHNLLKNIAVGTAFIIPMITNLNAPVLSIPYASILFLKSPVITQADTVPTSTPSQVSFVVAVDSPIELKVSPLFGVTQQDQLILDSALALATKYGSRPYWTELPFVRGEVVPSSTVAEVIEHIIPCENIDRLRNPDSTPKVLDSNNKYSYGLLQIQQGTWDKWSKESGITGDPTNAHDAIRMASWAVQKGYLEAWSCASILRLID